MNGRAGSAAYGCAVLAYAAGIFWASSLPRVSIPGDPGRALSLATNFFHVPLYAALTFLLAMSLSEGRRENLSFGARLAAITIAIACAGLDEWHQSFVPGRAAAASDLLLDAAGIGGMILLLSRESRMEASS